MDMSEGSKRKKDNLIVKTWKRCKSLYRSSPTPSRLARCPKSKSWPRMKAPPSSSIPSLEDDDDKGSFTPRKPRVAPEGCFSVYVGPQKQRFVIKTKYVNHPLFKILLEEAESEYGYNPEGPLALPCNVDFFYEVLVAMDVDIHNCDDDRIRFGCGFAKNHFSSYHQLTPPRVIALHHL